jgi:anti-sigma factor RsiW
MRECHNGAVTDSAEGDAHIQEEQLVLHYLGELDPARSDAVHRHLTACPRCGASAGEIVEVMAALTLADLDRPPATDA